MREVIGLKGIPERLRHKTLEMHGVEIFPGIGTPFSQTSRFGAVFVAACEGLDATRFLGWINYTPIFFEPGTVCSVIGGGWAVFSGSSLPVFGGFGRGSVSWNRNGKLALAEITLLHGSSTTGQVYAILNHFPFPPAPPTIEGTVRFF